ncbi:Pfam:RRM 6 [Teratosphaeria destructans]|uniref:Pfam:RRM 6 n=1 Tax=Teratosphaeria destructans TaxID=418781 RepID=A0A9W7W4I0_9PEZI|nr:Pfam:RRM 6 [Teratosphaeria destructans]
MSRSKEVSPESTKKKRKHDDIPEDEKLEIDINAPEPPSKKAKRLEKKLKKEHKDKDKDKKEEEKNAIHPDRQAIVQTKAHDDPPQRSEYGIWIGNLPWSATKDKLRDFLLQHASITDAQIVRIHMPPPVAKPSDAPFKPQNKGFAYIDFTTQDILDKAVALSETLLGGRRVLIKNAKSFEGRPDKPKSEQPGPKPVGGKPPAQRIFVGNLSFDVTKEDLAEHFSQAGEVDDIHMATFEDTGKCKGFAWVRFTELEAAEAAVRGFVYKKAEGDDSDEDGEQSGQRKKTKAKRHKHHINRLHGRELRTEFAEDATTRYKKRYGRGANAEVVKDRRDPADRGDTAAAEQVAPRPQKSKGRDRDKDQRREDRRKRHDARTVAPGAANANAQRASGAIVEGAGKKMVFDE